MIFSALIFMILLSSPLFAQVAPLEVSQFLPQEELNAITALPEPLPLDALIRLALIASGLSNDKLEEQQQAMLSLVHQLPPASGKTRQDGENLLVWMHNTVLSHYNETQTRLDVLLERGSYNCVSSAVLYHILARSQGLSVSAILTPDHAFSLLSTPEGKVDIETTTIHGFDPGQRRESVDAFTGRTGFVYVPPGQYAKRREIGEKELLALIYQNRVAMLQKQGLWANTVPLARDRWALLDRPDAAEDFRQSIMNYATDLDRKKKHKEGLLFLKEAADILGEDHGLEQSGQALFHNAITLYLRANRLEMARNFYDNKDLSVLISPDFLEEKNQDIQRHELQHLVRTAAFDQAQKGLNSAHIDEEDWQKLSLMLWSREAERLSRATGWMDAFDFLETAPNRVSRLKQWANLLQNYQHNAVIDFHNRFARAYQSVQWEEAALILDQAQQRFPDNRTLQKDRALLKKAEKNP